MATLQKIRNKGALLVTVVGLALLSFIIGDFLREGSTFFNQSKQVVAKIDGEDVNIKDYQAAIDQLSDVYKIETGKTEIDEQTMVQLRSSVWESFLTEKLLTDEAKKIGLAVSDEELSDHMIGNHIHPAIMQRRAFAGQDGQFSKAALLQFYGMLDQTPTNDEMRQQLDKLRNYWNYWQRYVKISLLQDKFNALMAKSVSANNLDAKMDYQGQKVSYDVKYVVKPYFMIPDASIAVTDNEIQDRYNKEKELFKQDANCSINYVNFEIKPSAEDFKEAQIWMNKLVNDFKTTSDVAGLVNSNSDVMYDGRNYSEQTVPVDLKSFAFGGKTGDVYGPVFENNTYTMARIVQSGILESDSVKLRHIFLPATDAGKADSLINLIKKGTSFAELARKYSAVKQTAANGGEIGWLQQGMTGIDKEILADAFSKPVNEVFTIKNAQGVQIMQATEKTPARRKVKLAILQRKVVPSSKTYGLIYNNAKDFAVNLKSTDFDKRAKDKGYVVRQATDILKNSEQVADLPQSRQIVRWAFKSSKGDVSDVFDCGTVFVVATTTENNPKGYKSVEKVTPQLKAEIIRDKKADMMIRDFQTLIQKSPTLEAIALSMRDSAKTAEKINFNSYQFGAAGFEPAVIGKVTVTPLGKLSAPVKGNAGVYVFENYNKTDNPQPYNQNMEIMQLNGRMSYSLPYMIFQNLKDNADIVDNRLNFF